MYHSLFICSQADGHLSCFQFSAVMIKAALITAVTFLSGHMSSFLRGKPLGRWTVGSVHVDLFLRNCKLFSMLRSFCLPSICVCLDQSEFSSLLNVALIVYLSHPNMCEAPSMALTAFPW